MHVLESPVHSMIAGAARSLDIGATYGFSHVYMLREYYHLDVGVDLDALRNDWIHVGNDLKQALDEYGQRVFARKPNYPRFL